jgi:exopolyphosphatase / guanosine-5'-triphosphate,3'-diphosphate pyrophosphatase
LRERIFGVVDIGSNTVHLLVARTNGLTIVPLVDLSENLRLGADVDSTGEISNSKLEEVIGTLCRFKEAAAAAGITGTGLHLLGTHAIRAASNRVPVCEAIKQVTGLQVEVLNPEHEAALSFAGAEADYPSAGPQVVVDIGGGSVQVSVGHGRQVWDSVSLPLGAGRLATHFVPTDPPAYFEEAALVTYLVSVIPEALPVCAASTGVLGVGGTLRRVPQLLNLRTGQSFPRDALERMLIMLRSGTSAEIGETFNLRPDRARLLMPAILVLREVWRAYNYPPLIMVAYGMREGAILQLARHNKI